jgi:hypothetical protein
MGLGVVDNGWYSSSYLVVLYYFLPCISAGNYFKRGSALKKFFKTIWNFIKSDRGTVLCIGTPFVIGICYISHDPACYIFLPLLLAFAVWDVGYDHTIGG